jgi:hypothetical protein
LKQLFYNAFTRNELVDQLSIVDDAFDNLEETRRHHVFSLHEKTPRFDIRTFYKSRGLRIYSDGSHPEAIEVEECVPLGIAGRLNDLDGKMGYLWQGSLTSQQLARANLGLLQAMARENYKRSSSKRGVDMRSKNQDQRKSLCGPFGIWQFPVVNTWLKHRKQILQ